MVWFLKEIFVSWRIFFLRYGLEIMLSMLSDFIWFVENYYGLYFYFVYMLLIELIGWSTFFEMDIFGWVFGRLRFLMWNIKNFLFIGCILKVNG